MVHLKEIVNQVVHLNKTTTKLVSKKSIPSPCTIQKGRGVVLIDQSRRKWVTVLGILAGVFICVYLMISFLIEYVINPALVPLPNTDKLYDEFEDPVDDIKEAFVPYVQDWFVDRQKSLKYKRAIGASQLLETDTKRNLSANFTCLDAFVEKLKDIQPTTDPSYAEVILRALGSDLYSSPTIRNVLHDLLTEPQELTAMYDNSHSCMRDNQPLIAMACVATEYNILPDLSKHDNKIIFRYAVTYAAVLEALTLHMESNLQDFDHFSQTMLHSRRREVESYYKKQYEDNNDLLEFLVAKYRTMALATQGSLNSKAQNGINNLAADASIKLNMLEAVKRDIQLEHMGNAEVGLAIAASVNAGRYSDSSHFFDQLGKAWVDAYIAWNCQFIVASLPSIAYLLLGKLLMPSILCTSAEHGTFIERRVISLSLSLMHMFDVENSFNHTPLYHQIPHSDLMVIEKFQNLSPSNPLYNTYKGDNFSQLLEDLGENSRRNIQLPDPSEDTIFEMLYKLCDERCHKPSTQSLISLLIDDDGHFTIYVGFINWITVVFTALAWEMFMILFYLKDGWTQTNEIQYTISEVMFSILSLITLGLGTFRNYLSLFTLVAGCWKFGFPETVATMYCALYNQNLSTQKRICLGLDSIGYLLHHSAASLAICMALTGNLSLDRYVVDILLILCIQHWFVLLTRYNKILYIAVELVLEVWYQWTNWSNFEQFAHNHWTAEVASLMMWLAHILWAISSLKEMFSCTPGPSKMGCSTSASDEIKDMDNMWDDDVER